MPNVNGKKYPYTKDGMKKAKAAAKKTGKKVKKTGNNTKGYWLLPKSMLYYISNVLLT